MLSFHQINQVESLFLAIDSKKIEVRGCKATPTKTHTCVLSRTHYYLIDDVIAKVYTVSAKQGEYLLWLLNRWIFLRNHPNHLPKRIIRFGQ